MFVDLKLDFLTALSTSDQGVFNNRDEVYCMVVGASSRGRIKIPRIPSESRDPDYFPLQKGDSINNQLLWNGYIGPGEQAALTILVREQDNGQLPSIGNMLSAVASGVGNLIIGRIDNVLEAVGDLAVSAAQLVDSIGADSDQTIAAFVVWIENDNGTLKAHWKDARYTNIAANGNQAVINANGEGGSTYSMRASVSKEHLPMIISVNSGKALDIAGGSRASGANLQQYTIHGRANQRWKLKYLGVGSAYPLNPGFYPRFAILNENSGQALDVAGGDTNNGANIQQYRSHYGPNQTWFLVPRPEGFVLLNRHSRKVMDVRRASKEDQANVLQWSFHGGANQLWEIRY